MNRIFCCVLVSLSSVCGVPAKVVVKGEIVERDGIARKATVLEQGIPVEGISDSEAKGLVMAGPDGKVLPGSIEVEARDEHGRPRWLRLAAVVAIPAGGRLPVTVETGSPVRAGKFTAARAAAGIVVETDHYRLALSEPNRIELSSHGHQLLSGELAPELIGDARGILWGAYFHRFVPAGIQIEEQSDTRATLLLSGYVSTGERKQPEVADRGRRIDVEVRLFVDAFSPRIRFAWRMTNQFGHKVWLQRYALKFPLAERATLAGQTGPGMSLLAVGPGRLAVTADFIEDLGRGAGMSLVQGGTALLHGGIHMPPDGGYYSGRVPDIHRMFHDGMSRTFTGTLIPDGAAEEAAEALAPVDIVLPAQYYSDVKALPESGDPVTFGEFEPAVKRAAEWLLKNQWRGTLWWGEWYREWDDSRDMAVQEASNGHSPLAPLYHYWRTGDARFLRCAQRSAEYVWDIQMYRGSKWVGWMFHTRRHLFDELDWIHPRYQRATGGLIASHVFLNPVARREVIKTVRNFHDRYFDEKGIPHDWDRVRNVRGKNEDGVDTSNFMEALTYCYRETGDRYFLDEALKMSRWTGARWKARGTRKGDDWNWNLTNYALRGLYTLWESSRDTEVFDLMTVVDRTTMANADAGGYDLKDGIGSGAEAHFAFYHAWISARIARLCPDRDRLNQTLIRVVRRETGRVREDGLIPLSHGDESGLPTVWTSYYDAKALAGYVPVLSAYMESMKKEAAR